MSEEFVWSDAWILLTIIYSGGCKGQSTDLAHTTQAADFINHAVPTDDELKGALERLQLANLIRQDNGNYRASDLALEAYARISTPHRDVHKEIQSTAHLLNVRAS
jgi:hypothetical protein